MVKVYLVEDEIIIRQSIKNSIDWEKEGMNLSVMPVMVNWHCR